MEGHVRLVRELYTPTDDITVLSSVKDQRDYDLPLDFVDSTDLIWQFTVSHLVLGKWDRKALLAQIPQSGDPSNYAIDEARKKLMIFPIPSGSAQTTTLSPGISASDTTITVVSTSGFGGSGWIIIQNEIIQYTAITTTTFTGCVRGACNTTAAAHSTAVTVTWGDIALSYTRLPIFNRTLYKTGTVTVTNGSPTVSGVGTAWLNGQNIYAGNYIGIGALSTTSSNETFPLVWYKILSIDSQTQITLTSNYAEATGALQAYIITSKSELYEQDIPVIVNWAEYICESRRLKNKEKGETARLAYNSEMKLAKERLNGPDNLWVVRNTKFARYTAHYERD